MTRTLKYLLELVKKYGLFKPIKTSTTKLANLFDVSQQSVSRILIDLEKNHFITRHSSTKGITIKFEAKSIKMLKETYDILNEYFSEFSIKGKIRKGIGEGKYYVTHDGYKKQFREILDLEDSYPGTLNLEVDPDYLKTVKVLFTPKIIEGFETEKRSFGSLKCYKCLVNNEIIGWVVFAKRTTHPKDIIEIISKEEIDKSNETVTITFVQ